MHPFPPFSLCLAYVFPPQQKEARNGVIPGLRCRRAVQRPMSLPVPRLHQFETMSSYRNDVAMVRVNSGDPPPQPRPAGDARAARRPRAIRRETRRDSQRPRRFPPSAASTAGRASTAKGWPRMAGMDIRAYAAPEPLTESRSPSGVRTFAHGVSRLSPPKDAKVGCVSSETHHGSWQSVPSADPCQARQACQSSLFRQTVHRVR